MSSIFKRKRSGRIVWVAELPLGRDANGRRRRQTIYGATKAEVEEKLKKRGRDADEGRIAEPGKVTLAGLVERWLAHKAQSLAPVTLGVYRSCLDTHVMPRIGGIRCSRLEAVHVLDLLAELERDGVGRRAQQITLDVLRRACAFGVKPAKLLTHNPVEEIDRPSAPKPEVRSLTAEQARKLLETARAGDATVEAVVALGLCGLRRGELFGARWQDVDLELGQVLHVRQSLKETAGSKARKVKSERIVGPLKTKSARRDVPLPPFAIAALRRHREALPATPHPAMLIFQTENGTPIRFSNFARRHFEPLIARAGLPPETTLHVLRHTAATLLIGSKVDVKSVQSILGHARAATTLDIYADAMRENVDAAMVGLGVLVGHAMERKVGA